MSVLEYIEENDIPVLFWLDMTDPNQYSIIGNTFRIENKYGNPGYSFIQNETSKHPVITPSGLSFSTNSYLVPVNSFQLNSLSEYSCIFISTSLSESSQTVIDVSKTNNAYPSYLNYKYLNKLVQQRHSFSALRNIRETNAVFPANIQVSAISHDVKYGVTNIGINNLEAEFIINADKGRPLPSITTEFRLGNNLNSDYFKGILQHVFFCDRKVSVDTLLTLAQQAVNFVELSSGYQNNILPFFYQDKLNFNIDFESDSVLNKLSQLTSNIDYIDNIESSFQLLLNLFWDNLSTSEWNTIDLDLWNTME